MERIKGKVNGFSVDTDDVLCPICRNYMKIDCIETQTSERGSILTDRRWGEDVVTAYAEERTFPVILKCPCCGSALRVEMETVRIERKEEREMRMVDMMAAMRFGKKA